MYCVSYAADGLSSNRTFETLPAAEEYVRENIAGWQSACLYSYEPHPSGISELKFLRRIKPILEVGGAIIDSRRILQGEFP